MSKYEAIITPLNEEITGMAPKGKASFDLDEKRLTISIEMEGVTPNIMHRQDFHGMINDRMADPANMEQDVNHDGVLDVTEIEAVSGKPMLPFNEAPQRIDFSAETYPTANANGNYDYYKEVGIDELVRNFEKDYNDAKLDLAKRVIYIYGVAEDVVLPATVEGKDPHADLPIACGMIREKDEKVN